MKELVITKTNDYFPRPVNKEVLSECIKGLKKRLKTETDKEKRWRLKTIKREIRLLNEQL